jgi:antitoxin component HigA of HigAB toxin-antitoxin module
MNIETEIAQAPEFLKLVSKFPLEPIKEDHGYQAAIEILDRLFALDDRRSPAEMKYFRALAQIAYRYESKYLL